VFGVHAVPDCSFIRTPGGICHVTDLERILVAREASLLILTWHYAATDKGGQCAAHSGCKVTARAETYKLAHKMHGHMPNVTVVCAQIDTDSGRCTFDPQHVSVLKKRRHEKRYADAYRVVTNLQKLNEAHVHALERNGGPVTDHTEQCIVYGPHAHDLQVAHGEAFVISNIRPDFDGRAIVLALDVLKRLGARPLVKVAVHMNGCRNTALRAAEDVLAKVRPYVNRDICVQKIGVTHEGHSVALED
jgi:hypothetical protein